MDEITGRLKEMYSRFPYPSRNQGEHRLKELANLLRLFAVETGYDFRGKSVLDVGTGTGHRLIKAASYLPDTRFVAVDLCEPPLSIARATAREAGVTNVEFAQLDLLSDDADLGQFDVVLCMGVLHHLPDPSAGIRRLVSLLERDGLLFTYLYGAPGSGERMRRKQMLSVLLGEDAGSFDAGLELVKALGWASTPSYGWNLNADDESSAEALIVDSYLNVNEELFDVERIVRDMQSSDLDSIMVYGITSGAGGLLLDTDLKAHSNILTHWTDMAGFLPTPDAVARYERLGLRERYRMVELAFQPNGYTVLAYRKPASKYFAPGGRVQRNAIDLDPS